jgi:hypothetical protein
MTPQLDRRVWSARRHVRALARLVALAGQVLATVTPAQAQVRAFVTEETSPLDAGQVRISFGGFWGHDYEEPVYGLEGTLLQAPIVEADYGLGGVAELQVSGGLKTLWIDRRSGGPLSAILDIPGDRTSAPQDLVVATKVRVLQGRGARPELAVRLATKLPNAGNESGLGSDTTDFWFMVAGSWRLRDWRLVANLGTGIVGDPSQIGVQHDPTLYALQVARRVNVRTEILAEISGRWLPGHPSRPGSEDRGDVRAGLRRGVGRWRLDAGLVAGLTSIDASLGVSAMVSRTFGF